VGRRLDTRRVAGLFPVSHFLFGRIAGCLTCSLVVSLTAGVDARSQLASLRYARSDMGKVRVMVESAAGSTGRIFISYRRDETAYPAGWLYDRLADHYGDGQVFKDVDSVELGDDFVEVITRAVGSCDVLLALIGDQWLTITDKHGGRRLDDPHDFVRLEIEAALARNVRLIPILVDGAKMPSAEELPHSLHRLVRRQALELSPVRFDSDTSRLLKVLDTTLAAVRTAQTGAASTTAPAGTGPDPRTTALPTAERREQPEPSPPTRILPNLSAASASASSSDRGRPTDKLPRRLSTRARILAGLIALATLLSLLVVVVVAARPAGDDANSGAANSGAANSGPANSGAANSGPAILLASFEDGTEGWLPEPGQDDNGSVSQASDFHTQGSFSLQIINGGLPERGWYGKNFPSPIDISGKKTVTVDIKTLEAGTQTAIAAQFGDNWIWCQSPQPWEWAHAGTDRTVTLNLDAAMDCPDGRPSASDLSKLNAVWVWFEGKGSFGLDNVRVE
jgi:hypothetical protein